MRIPYPERIPYSWATLAAVVLFLVQLMQGTSVAWAMCCFCFIVLAVTGVNLAGGLYRPSGAFIFFNALLTVVIGVVMKAVFGEAADSNLQAPMHTIEVYMLGMAAMCFAALVENRVRSKDSLLTLWFPVTTLRTVYIGVLTVGIGLNFFWMSGVSFGSGTFLSALHNADNMFSFGIVLGVIYTVRSTNGKRSMTPILAFAIALMTIEGLLSYTKQGLLTGAFCWALGAGVSRYRLRAVNYVCLAGMGFLVIYYAVPVIQLGKSLPHGTTLSASIAQTTGLFRNLEETRANQENEEEPEREDVNYYNKPEGFLDRLEMIGIDDLLIDETDRDGTFGYEPTKEGWENLIPHFIWRDKPVPYFGNYWAHQLYLLPEGDATTGVSFSPTADAYKEGGFTGVLVMEPLCFIAIFCSLSWMLGDVRDHPVAVVLVILVAHIAPEGAIPGAIQLIFIGGVALGVGFFVRYFTPIVSSAVLPPERLENGALVTALD